MNRLALAAIDRPELAPWPISTRLRSQLLYFSTKPEAGLATSDDEYWFDEGEVARVLHEGVITLVSPLDTAHMTEVEISEEQEALLGWLLKNRVRHVRVVE